MPNLFRILLTALLCLVSVPAGSQPDKKGTLIRQVVKRASCFEDMETILDIIKSRPDIFKHIPGIHPIAEKNNPRVSSPYGKRFHPVDKVYKFHSGIDFTAEYATTVHATGEGKVIFAGVKGGYGKCVIIQHTMGFKTLYAHLTEYYTGKGKIVRKGDIIGFLGNTGKSTGAHLHYEIIKNGYAINPERFLAID
jgi:murein DD-endopeptidase MepM/ murein hydrolase activator NlpD